MQNQHNTACTHLKSAQRLLEVSVHGPELERAVDARLHRAVLSRRPLSWRHRCRSAQVRQRELVALVANLHLRIRAPNVGQVVHAPKGLLHSTVKHATRLVELPVALVQLGKLNPQLLRRITPI